MKRLQGYGRGLRAREKKGSSPKAGECRFDGRAECCGSGHGIARTSVKRALL